jgi:hypothetical protein
MLNLNKRPFNWLPLNQGDLFDLTCEYTISIIHRINRQYQTLIGKAEELTEKMPAPSDFILHKDLLLSVDNFIDDYAKLIKSSKLALGENIGNVKSKKTIFSKFSYLPNAQLQSLIVHGLRNTQQHFEERLQDFQTQINPFLQLSYKGQNITWEITFGNGGYRHKGRSNKKPEIFNNERFFFQSYLQHKGSLINQTIKINDVWRDVLNIMKLIEENMEKVIAQKNICCPPVRNVSVFVTQDR